MYLENNEIETREKDREIDVEVNPFRGRYSFTVGENSRVQGRVGGLRDRDKEGNKTDDRRMEVKEMVQTDALQESTSFFKMLLLNKCSYFGNNK